MTRMRKLMNKWCGKRHQEPRVKMHLQVKRRRVHSHCSSPPSHSLIFSSTESAASTVNHSFTHSSIKSAMRSSINEVKGCSSLLVRQCQHQEPAAGRLLGGKQTVRWPPPPHSHLQHTHTCTLLQAVISFSPRYLLNNTSEGIIKVQSADCHLSRGLRWLQ